jgi:hypothetical protein
MGAWGRRRRQLLRAAARRWPTNPFWPFFLALSYTNLAREAPTGTEARRRYAAEAIRWYEREEGLWPRDPVQWRNPHAEEEYTHLRNRGTMAWLALECGDVRRAEGWAEDAQRIPHVVRQVPWRSHGNPLDVGQVHCARIVLGKIALDRGEGDEADRQLLLAAKAWSVVDGYLEFGTPDFTLAQQLLNRGRTESVVAYLESCRDRWIYAEQHVDRWLHAIESGGVPDLEPWRSTRPSLRLGLRGLRLALGRPRHSTSSAA